MVKGVGGDKKGGGVITADGEFLVGEDVMEGRGRVRKCCGVEAGDCAEKSNGLVV